MNTTGTARASCATCFWRPMRCCSAENGSGRRSRKASTSPSSTVPSGSREAAAAISGKRCGDQLLAARPQMDRAARAASAARGCRPISTRSASPPARRAPPVRPPAATARKNGYGRDRSASDRSRRQADEPVGGRRPFAHEPRRDDVAGSDSGLGQRAHDQRLRHADAQLAGEQLSSMKRCSRSSRAHHSVDATPAARPVQRRGAAGSRSSTHCSAAARSSAGVRWQLIEDQRRRFGAVADDRVALAEHPVREAGRAIVQSRIAARARAASAAGR